jgi:hypothetical protein
VRVEVLYIERHMSEGLDPSSPWPLLARRVTHRSFLTADFARRFRPAYMGPGWSETTVTAIVPPGTEWNRDRPTDLPTVKHHRYLSLVERFVWPLIAWVRSRWYGLRYGLDPDRRR